MSERKRVLVVEDERAIRLGLEENLKFAGFEVLTAEDGPSALKMGASHKPDLILLDIMLPGMSGYDVCRKLRDAGGTMPIIMLTARQDEFDKLHGFEMGADDYVTKPFSVKELLARIEAVLRRSPARPVDVDEAAIPGGKIDFARREVRLGDVRHELSEREAELLRYLVSNAGRAIPRDELLTNVWRISADGLPTRTIDMHVARLREKLQDDGDDPRILLTVRGVGYMFAEVAHWSAAPLRRGER